MWKTRWPARLRNKRLGPFAWAEAPGYEHAEQRGSASGRLVINDTQAPSVSAAGAWVGLAQGPYTAEFATRGPTTIDWQTDGKHYQYWARADGEGRFNIANARPGTYTLYAFTDGVLGEFSPRRCSSGSRKEDGSGGVDLDAGALWPAALGNRHPQPQR